MSYSIDRIENTVEDMSSVVAPERARWTLPAGQSAPVISAEGHLLVVHAETVARWLETMKLALDAVRERDAEIAGFVANERNNLGAAILLQDEIARLRSALVAASGDLSGGDARAVMVRTGIDIVLAVTVTS